MLFLLKIVCPFFIIVGKDTPPAATLHSRPKESKHETTPAPGDYNPEKSEKIVHDNSPKYTFGLKTAVEKTSHTPGKYNKLDELYFYLRINNHLRVH